MITSEDVGQIYKQGAEKAKGFDISSFNYRADAEAQRATAKAATISTVFGVGSTALGAASQVNKYYMDQKAAKGPKLPTLGQ